MGFDEKRLVQEGAAWVERPGESAVELSTGTIAVAWSIDTVVDQVWIVAYRDGVNVRELRFARGQGWTKTGKPLPFENTAELGKWLRKKQLFASPDGYDVLDAFLGKKPPAPVVEVGATFTTTFAPAHAAELAATAAREQVAVSAVVEASWHAAKQAIYDRLMRIATKQGLDLTMLVDDTSPPAPLHPLPAFVREAVEVPAIDLTRYAANAIPHQLALSARMRAELEHMSTMFDVPAHRLLDDAYRAARGRLAAR